MMPSRIRFGSTRLKSPGVAARVGVTSTFLNTFDSTSSSADKVTETLYDNTAAKHIGKSCDTFAVSVAVLKWLGEMFCNEKCKVGVVGLLLIGPHSCVRLQ